MADKWNAKKFLTSFVTPQLVGAFVLESIEYEDDREKAAYFFKPYGAKEEVDMVVYAKWQPEAGILTLWQTIATEIPYGKTTEVLGILNKMQNMPGAGMITKACVIPAGVVKDRKNITLACGWDLGLYEVSLTEEKSDETLKALVLTSMLRIMMEVINLTLGLGETYPKWRTKN